MDLIPAPEAARRARAAISYSGLDQREVCKRTGIKMGTLRNIISKSRPSGGTPPRLRKIAVACDVPPAFMEVGFAPLAAPLDDVTKRMIEIERATAERLARLEAQIGVTDPEGAAHHTPLSDFERRVKESRSDAQRPGQGDSDQDKGAQRGSGEA